MLFIAAIAFLFLADVRECACDPKKPETMAGKECSLCREAEMQPPGTGVFFLKDVNPSKPNRLLALPRQHYPGPNSLEQMTAADREVLWSAAIEKSKSLWGEEWGVAYNGDERRTQCHAHIHIGKLLPESENERFVVVESAAGIPAPRGGEGMWVHPVGGKLHVHAGEQVNEFVLQR